MITYSFTFRNPSQEKSPLRLVLRDGAAKEYINVSIYDNGKYFDPSKHRFNKVELKYLEYNERLRQVINSTESWISTYLSAKGMSIKDLKKAIAEDISDPKLEKKNTNVLGKQKKLFFPYFKKYVQELTKDPSSNNRGKNLDKLYRRMTHVANEDTLTFDDINYAFYCKLVEYMKGEGLNGTTCNNYINELKIAVNKAYKLGLHTGLKFKEAPKEKVSTEHISLTQQDLTLIESCTLSKKKLQKALDLFIIGCHTALRYSDYSRLSMEHVKDNKISIVPIKTRKTDARRVVIPLHPKVKSILEKYGGVLPSTTAVAFNVNIKEALYECGLTEPVTLCINGKFITKPKYEWVSSHTARRTGATLMFKAGIPSISIMKITGHTTESSFLKYIKVSNEENADMIMDNPFFTM